MTNSQLQSQRRIRAINNARRLKEIQSKKEAIENALTVLTMASECAREMDDALCGNDPDAAVQAYAEFTKGYRVETLTPSLQYTLYEHQLEAVFRLHAWERVTKDELDAMSRVIENRGKKQRCAGIYLYLGSCYLGKLHYQEAKSYLNKSMLLRGRSGMSEEGHLIHNVTMLLMTVLVDVSGIPVSERAEAAMNVLNDCEAIVRFQQQDILDHLKNYEDHALVLSLRVHNPAGFARGYTELKKTIHALPDKIHRVREGQNWFWRGKYIKHGKTVEVYELIPSMQRPDGEKVGDPRRPKDGC